MNGRLLTGIVFDMDGTLTLPAIDFDAMRRRLNIPPGRDILLTVREWPLPRRRWAMKVIDAVEANARRHLELQPGTVELLHFLTRRGLRKALLTRNSTAAVRLLERRLDSGFSVVVTRDFPLVKPHPEPLQHVCRTWRTDPGTVLMVGDYRDDMLCARAAGVQCCLLRNDHDADAASLADFTVASLGELHSLLLKRQAFPP